MKNGLYRLEVYMSLPSTTTAETAATNPTETDDGAMITNGRGVFFAKLHPVKIMATPARGCVYCNEMQVTEVIPYNAEGGMASRPVYYCFNCGRNLQKREGQT